MVKIQKLHPHYQILRALADSYEIEWYDPLHKAWQANTNHFFSPSTEFRIVPDAEGWVPYYCEEGSRPINASTVVEVRCREGSGDIRKACKFNWFDIGVGSITHYRVLRQEQVHQVPEDCDIISWRGREIRLGEDL